MNLAERHLVIYYVIFLLFPQHHILDNCRLLGFFFCFSLNTFLSPLINDQVDMTIILAPERCSVSLYSTIQS